METTEHSFTKDTMLLSRHDFPVLFSVLHRLGYTIIGPQVGQRAIHYNEIQSPDDLPHGWTDVQDAGYYRLTNVGGAELFGYTAGAQSWKRFLFRPKRVLWCAYSDGPDFKVETIPDEVPRLAFLGMRACELRAIEIQDHIFMRVGGTDHEYSARRHSSFLIAVNCTKAADTCFCESMAAGPRAKSGYDIAMTELIDDMRHDFLLEIGSRKGALLARQLPLQKATADDIETARFISARTGSSMKRSIATNDLKELLQSNLEHQIWTDVAERCLACGNCTLSCPTCFCHSEEDTTDLEGTLASRIQRWDSCFTMDFSHLVGGPVRGDIRTRYRQWLTHKLANWIDQFYESGCVGCGRCITWCPAGIDITEEVNKLCNVKVEA